MLRSSFREPFVLHSAPCHPPALSCYMKAGMAAAVPLALAAVCHGDKSLCLQFDLGTFYNERGGAGSKLDGHYSLSFNSWRTATDCAAQQSAYSLENLINYAPSLPHCNWSFHWSMPAHLSLEVRAHISFSPKKIIGSSRAFSQVCLLLCHAKNLPFSALSLAAASDPPQFISSLCLSSFCSWMAAGLLKIWFQNMK